MSRDNHNGSMSMRNRGVAMALAFLASANCGRAGDDERSAAAANRNLAGRRRRCWRGRLDGMEGGASRIPLRPRHED